MNELNIKKGETYGWRDEAGEHVGVVQWTGYDVACMITKPNNLKMYVPKTQLHRQLSNGEGGCTPVEITKQKAGKPEWGRILSHIPNALLAMVAVRKYGNDKYRAIAEKAGVQFDSEGWRKNTAQDYLESAQRHVAALFAGERTNEEDGGVHHAAQAAIDLCFFFEIEHSAKKEDMK